MALMPYGRMASLVQGRFHSHMTSTPPEPPRTDKHQLVKRNSTNWEILSTLLTYVWPKNDFGTKARVILALSLLLAGKLLNVQVPFFFKAVVDRMNDVASQPLDLANPNTVWVVAGASILGYGVARIGASAFSELRNAVFANVAQRSIRKIARSVFTHLLLSLIHI